MLYEFLVTMLLQGKVRHNQNTQKPWEQPLALASPKNLKNKNKTKHKINSFLKVWTPVLGQQDLRWTRCALDCRQADYKHQLFI